VPILAGGKSGLISAPRVPHAPKGESQFESKEIVIFGPRRGSHRRFAISGPHGEYGSLLKVLAGRVAHAFGCAVMKDRTTASRFDVSDKLQSRPHLEKQSFTAVVAALRGSLGGLRDLANKPTPHAVLLTRTKPLI
jgi:hypothetical protein